MPTPAPPSSRNSGSSPRRLQNSDDEAIKVAVSCRCFMPHLKENDVLSCTMQNMDQGSKITVHAGGEDSSYDDKTFNFDYTINMCSHEVEDRLGPFKSQEALYDEIGVPILDNALAGRSTTLFAYGSTGSGKTYSMLGDPSNKEKWGVIPRVCARLYEILNERKAEDARQEYKVSVCVYEVYMETINDLLLPRDKWPERGLDPKFNAETRRYEAPTSHHVCHNTSEILDRIIFADANRSVGSHNLNNRSSRAHTIYQIDFESALLGDGEKLERTKSRINLVDLAGSESTESAGTTGLMRKQGVLITKSLVTLGRVIRSLGKLKPGQKPIGVPFRESNLTLLLQSALSDGKITMLAAISPSASKYQGTLSTLSFASDVKKVIVRSNVTKTFDDTATKIAAFEELTSDLEATIEELQKKLQDALKDKGDAEEIERLKEELEFERQKEKDTKESVAELSDEKAQELRAKLEEEIRKEFEENMKNGIGGAAIARADSSQEEVKLPHFLNLSPEPELSEKLIYKLQKGDSILGRRDKNYPPTFEMHGPGIVKRHCRFEYEHNTNMNIEKVFIENLSKQGAVFVNGDIVEPSQGKVELFHWDRIWLGTGSAFRFEFPGNELSCRPMKKMNTLAGDSEMRTTTSSYYNLGGRNNRSNNNSRSAANFEGMGDRVVSQSIRSNESSPARVGASDSGSGVSRSNGALRAAQSFVTYSDETPAPDYAYAEAEMNKKERQRKMKRGEDTNVLSSAVIETYKKVENANIIAGDICRDAFFRLKIISDTESKHLVPVVIASINNAKFVWTEAKFDQRFFSMSDLWQKFLRYQDEDRVDDFSLPEDDNENPFIDNEPQFIGSTRLFLAPLRHMMDIEMNPPILTQFGTKEGLVQMFLVPLDKNGNEGPWDDDENMDLDPFRAESCELLNDEIQFCFKLGRLQWNLDVSSGEKIKYKNVFARFKLNEHDVTEKWIESEPVERPALAPNLAFSKKFTQVVDDRFYKYLGSGSIKVEIWADPILEVNSNPFNTTYGATMKPHLSLEDDDLDEEDKKSRNNNNKPTNRRSSASGAGASSAMVMPQASAEYECVVDQNTGEETLRQVEVVPEIEAGKALISGKTMPEGWKRVRVVAYKDPEGIVHLVPPHPVEQHHGGHDNNSDDDGHETVGHDDEGKPIRKPRVGRRVSFRQNLEQQNSAQ